MRVAIMQPYFMPYVGYFHLIRAVDLFILYDNIKYTKKGWINRNRMLQNGNDVMFSLPLKSDSDFLDVRERELATDFDRDKLLNRFKGAYLRAPYFSQTFPLVEDIVHAETANLFEFLYHSILRTCAHLNISTEIKVASCIAANHALKSQDRVLALCAAVGASTYVNAAGGQDLYSKEDFMAKGIDLKFIKSRSLEYAQFDKKFVPWLSIIDVMMFNSREKICSELMDDFELV